MFGCPLSYVRFYLRSIKLPVSTAVQYIKGRMMRQKDMGKDTASAGECRAWAAWLGTLWKR